MQNIQNYLKRLVVNEGNFAEQVEDRRERYNITERLENIENEAVEFDETADIEYEDENELVSDLI
jgi:predicted transcriptional regulator